MYPKHIPSPIMTRGSINSAYSGFVLCDSMDSSPINSSPVNSVSVSLELGFDYSAGFTETYNM